MKNVVCLLIAIAILSVAAAQNKGKITAVVLNADSKPIESATAELLRSKDSALVKAGLSDKAGNILFEDIDFGNYFVRVTNVGSPPYQSTAFDLNVQVLNLPAISLSASNNATMQGVTVTAKKPFIQKLSDRIVVNVENSIVSAGSSALDVLERSPGITLDQNDAVSLRGKAGVVIMIDGKPSPMSGADLANYLRGLPSNAIERIEIITNPSAKYDAAGNSGIIDIKMKKDQRLGSNGTVTLGYGQGIYPKANGGTTFNYRNKVVNIFGNYNYAYRKNLNHLVINRNFFEDGVFQGADNKDNYGTMRLQSHTARVGADFFPSTKSIIGFVVSSNFNGFNRKSDVNTFVNDEALYPKFNFSTISTNNDHFENTVANINYKLKIDSTGKELTADVDYGVFNSTSLTRTASSFFNVNGSKRKEDDILDGDQDGRLTLKTAKVDYVNPMKSGAKLEFGAKTSYVSSDNDAKFFNVLPSGSVVDDTKTNRFFYGEYNNAAYVNFSKAYKKFDFQIGLRGEQTNIKTRQVKGNKLFSDAYFQLFPSAFFNYKLKEDQTIGTSVSRRIDRPGYSQLNPFLFQIDATIYSTGNPLLKPQTTWSYELNYTNKSMNFTLGYSRTIDPQNSVLSKILDVIPDFEIAPGLDSNITVQIPVNLSSSDYFGLTASVPVRLSNWWNMINNLTVYKNTFQGNLGGVQLNDGDIAANVKMNNSFTLKKGWSAELNGSFNSGGRYGYMVMDPQWSLSAGVQKTILSGKGLLRLNVSDIFWTNLPKATVEYPGSYVENWHAKRDSRVANLTFTYRFGNNKVQAARKRTTGSEEERQRAGGN